MEQGEANGPNIVSPPGPEQESGISGRQGGSNDHIKSASGPWPFRHGHCSSFGPGAAGSATTTVGSIEASVAPPPPAKASMLTLIQPGQQGWNYRQMPRQQTFGTQGRGGIWWPYARQATIHPRTLESVASSLIRGTCPSSRLPLLLGGFHPVGMDAPIYQRKDMEG